MKFKAFIPAIVIFLIGIIFTIIGALFKVLHWELGHINGGYLLAIGSIVEVISVVIVILMLLVFYFRRENN